jgi:serine/threonine protein kinase
MDRIDHTGEVIEGKYQLIELLGEGGMGLVYLGRHLVIGRQVAVKFLHSELTNNPEVVKRFYREAQAAASIEHKNIIDVMDVGVTENGEPFLVMEYLEGEGLAELLERIVRVDLPTACAILEPTLLALSAAHEKGIVHRDLKPENIFLVHLKDAPPDIKLIDFGISKVAPSSVEQTKLTQNGSMLGTPAYMSPEQIRGSADVDHRADLYSIGVIFYEMLTGAQPFEGANYNELLVNALTTEHRLPTDAYADFPEQALPVINRSLKKSADDRYQCAEELLEDIRSLATVEERMKNLDILGNTICKNSITGDLGPEILTPDAHAATSLLNQVIAGNVSSKEPRLVDKLVAFKQRPLLAVGSLVALLLLIAISIGLCSEADDESVEITVRGAPKSAKIYYNDSLVTVNPFRVELSDIIVPLRVEARGHRKYKITVVPKKDLVVDVEMKPFRTKSGPTTGSKPKKKKINAAARTKASKKKNTETISRKASKPSKKPKDGKKSQESQSTSEKKTETKKSKNPFKNVAWPWKKKKSKN